MRALLPLTLAYLLLACLSTWPAILHVGSAVPGAERTDLWDSLWSLWFFREELLDGSLLRTERLAWPKGGVLMVADPLGALLAMPLLSVLSLPTTYTLLVLFQLTLAGLAAHLLAEDVLRRQLGAVPAGAGFIAGTAYATAAVLLSGVHNGNSEAFSGGWTALAVWLGWRAAAAGGGRRIALALAAIVLGSLASWYSAVVIFLFLGAILALPPERPWKAGLGARLAVLLLGVALVAPLAKVVAGLSTHPDNLLGIKGWRELMGIRRSTGAADVLGYLVPGDFRSPDFRLLSRYGENFFHCYYLGYVALVGGILGWRRQKRGLGWLALGGLAGLVLSLGPVLVRQAVPLILPGNRAIPLPYFLLEPLPGFGSLSLVYRLALAPSLALAVLAGAGLGGRLWPAAVAGILLEGRILSPLAGLPDAADATVSPAIQALAAAPEGAVMNFPIAGGRAYLYEQTVHGKPVTDSLNFPNTAASKAVWTAMLRNLEAEDALFMAQAGAAGRAGGVRYLVVHEDPDARPDMHDLAVARLRETWEPLAEGDGVEVYQLW